MQSRGDCTAQIGLCSLLEGLRIWHGRIWSLPMSHTHPAQNLPRLANPRPNLTWNLIHDGQLQLTCGRNGGQHCLSANTGVPISAPASVLMTLHWSYNIAPMQPVALDCAARQVVWPPETKHHVFSLNSCYSTKRGPLRIFQSIFQRPYNLWLKNKSIYVPNFHLKY